VESYIA